jgi:hypothetical protein
MIVSIRSSRKFGLLALLLLLLSGCGSDDEPSPASEPQGTVSEATTATTETQSTEVEPETETLPNDGDGTGTGESGPGGAGDEVSAETLALFTGKDGAITPRTVRVPAFISVRVQLRSADGGAYALRFDDRVIKVGQAVSSLGARFDGLRPGAKLVGKASTGGQVIVAATAEPGP